MIKTEYSYRNSNVELLRIIAMFSIVANHYVNFGITHGVIANQYDFWMNGSLINRLFTAVLQGGGHAGVALFFMISGFFSINRERISVRKAVGEIVFYGVFGSVMLIILNVLGSTYSKVSLSNRIILLIKSMLTMVSSGIWWFATTYILLMLYAPQINRMIGKLDCGRYFKVLLFMWLTIYLIDGVLESRFAGLYRGIFFYCLGGFLKLHGADKLKHVKTGVLTAVAVTSFLTSSALLYIMDKMMVNTEPIKNQIIYAISNGLQILIPVVLCAISLLLIFLRRSFVNETVNLIASTMFGVYLIHEYPAIRWFIWKDLLKVEMQYQEKLFPILAIGSVFAVVIVCSLLDLGRKFIIGFTEKRMSRNIR